MLPTLHPQHCRKANSRASVYHVLPPQAADSESSFQTPCRSPRLQEAGLHQFKHPGLQRNLALPCWVHLSKSQCALHTLRPSLFFFLNLPCTMVSCWDEKTTLFIFNLQSLTSAQLPGSRGEKNLLAGWLMRQMMCLVLVSVAELYPLQVSKNLRYWMGLVNNREKTKGTTHWDPNTGVIQPMLSHRRFYLFLKYFILCKKK